MAYLNVNNMCIFGGRLVSDPELNFVQTNGGADSFAKCKIKIAVDRNMSKDAKQKAQSANQPTADFAPIEVIGKKAEMIANYFSKGDGIRIVSKYRSYSYQNQQGETVYSHAFDAVDVGFCIGGNGNGNGNNTQNNNGGQQGFQPMGLDPQGFQSIDDDDLPF